METLILVSVSLATIIYILGFIMIFTYKRDKIKDMDEKLEALNNILDSCDKMVDELNNLSDYIISNIEDKSSQLNEHIHEADRKIKELHLQVKTVFGPKDTVNNSIEEVDTNLRDITKKRIKKSKNDLQKDEIESVEQIKINENIKPIEKPVIKEIETKKNSGKNVAKTTSTVINAYENNLNFAKQFEDTIDKKPKILDSTTINEHSEIMDRSRKFSMILNTKSREVVELSKQGLDNTQIAKKLGIGKGEIEFILGLKK